MKGGFSLITYHTLQLPLHTPAGKKLTLPTLGGRRKIFSLLNNNLEEKQPQLSQ